MSTSAQKRNSIKQPQQPIHTPAHTVTTTPGKSHNNNTPQSTIIPPTTTTSSQYQPNNNNKNSKNNNMMLLSASTNTYSSAGNGAVYQRIRAPHPNDVLSGRGGGINAHDGNVQFREWVRVRKQEYNLAPTKAEKVRIAQQVIDLVRARSPAGRFLQKDPTGGLGGGWWVELDEERVMAKTSQALREGAPQIRAAHQQSMGRASTAALVTSGRQRKSARSSTSKATTPTLLDTSTTSPPVTPSGVPISTTPLNRTSPPLLKRPFTSLTTSVQQRAIQQLQANVVEAQTHDQHDTEHTLELLHEQQLQKMTTEKNQQPATTAAATANVVENTEPPGKRVRVEYNGHTLRPADESPPLMAQDASDLPPILDLMSATDLPPLPQRRSLSGQDQRLNSLALDSPTEGDEDWEFVNPFENESFLLEPHLTTTNGNGHGHKELGGRRDSSGSEGGGAPPSLPPRVGIFHRETSTSSDMGGLGALLDHNQNNNSNNNNNNPRVRSLTIAARNGSGATSSNNNGNNSSHSSRALIKDWPVETDFDDNDEGLKEIYDFTNQDENQCDFDQLCGEDDDEEDENLDIAKRLYPLGTMHYHHHDQDHLPPHPPPPKAQPSDLAM